SESRPLAAPGVAVSTNRNRLTAQHAEPVDDHAVLFGSRRIDEDRRGLRSVRPMMLNGGELNGKRFVSPRTIELMTSNHTGEMVNGQFGRPAPRRGVAPPHAHVPEAGA